MTSDLQSALDRLSRSLEQIQELLGQLQVSSRLSGPNAAGQPGPTVGKSDQRPPSEEAHVIRGGGPSAFARPHLGA